jgi:hypothetical protein
MKEEIRKIKGVDYKVIKTPCKCPCHEPDAHILHIRACCSDGYVERLEKIKKETEEKND